MADIIQAAKWLMQGKKVTRRRCPAFRLVGEVLGDEVQANMSYVLRHSTDKNYRTRAHFQLADLLANDWEIAPEEEARRG